MDLTNINVVIPNFNGAEYLPRCIQSLLRAFEVYPGDHEIIVVDDGSTDGSVTLLEEEFPSVHVVKHSHNMGFSTGCNDGVRAASTDVVVLLNVDMYVDSGFLEPLVSHFQNGDTRLFSVGSRQIAWDEQTLLMGRMFPTFKRGLIDVIHEMDGSLTDPCENGVGPCGAGVFDREKYLSIGGLAELNRRNDVDLSYRALKRGWKLLYDPRSVIYHKGMHASKEIWTARQLRTEIQKDRILITWRNLTDVDLLVRHILTLPLLSLYWGRRTTVTALWQAIRRLPEVVRFRQVERKHTRLTDKQILRNWVGERGEKGSA